MSELEKLTIAKWSFAALLLSQGVLSAGCDAPSEFDEVVADTEEDQFRLWTGYTSEENPPLSCPWGEAVQGAHCTGRYCDNTSLYCATTGRATGWGGWTPYFSEEGSANGQCVGGDMWMTGISCNGSYCDNISLLCSQMIGSATGSCAWSGWYSEEQGPFYAPWGHYVDGIQCNGRYCDNKRYRYCQML